MQWYVFGWSDFFQNGTESATFILRATKDTVASTFKEMQACGISLTILCPQSTYCPLRINLGLMVFKMHEIIVHSIPAIGIDRYIYIIIN